MGNIGIVFDIHPEYLMFDMKELKVTISILYNVISMIKSHSVSGV